MPNLAQRRRLRAADIRQRAEDREVRRVVLVHAEEVPIVWADVVNLLIVGVEQHQLRRAAWPLRLWTAERRYRTSHQRTASNQIRRLDDDDLRLRPRIGEPLRVGSVMRGPIERFGHSTVPRSTGASSPSGTSIWSASPSTTVTACDGARYCAAAAATSSRVALARPAAYPTR